ncbi:hypothetical protein Cni_G00053 [Canna indica]|uniref:RWP-RK domain-containing protein n=1 Tax=Canna indica TaxID=4628 RepID=A0AAQ3JKQ3_9LILI|nr:hypothetical protein Cni_G00053 [Canna indica]
MASFPMVNRHFTWNHHHYPLMHACINGYTLKIARSSSVSSSLSAIMEFNHLNNLLLEETFLSEWPQVGDHSLPNYFPLDPLSEPDGLKPLPESLGDTFIGFPPPLQVLPAVVDDSLALVPLEDEPLDKVQIDDLDLESFAWPIDGISSNTDDAMLCPLPPIDYCDSPSNPTLQDGEYCSAAIVPWNEEKAAVVGKRAAFNGRASATTAAAASRLSEIGFDEIKNYFYMPITEAAKEMNVGLTVLKKRCREVGIYRWPHRKMKSLKSLIHNVQELGKGICEESIRKELERLEEHRKKMEENPEMQLTERTKRLRQACFKANYKRRRMLHHHPLH